MCWRLRHAKELYGEIPLSQDEIECMREAQYQTTAYTTPGTSQPPAQLDPGALYDWRRGGFTSSSKKGLANGNSLLKQAIANRMTKESPTKETLPSKDELQRILNDEGRTGENKEEWEEEKDEMSTSLVMNAAWFRDDEGKTGYKTKNWEKEAERIQKEVVKERRKKRDEERAEEEKVEEIDEELTGEVGKKKEGKETKEEKKERERLEKERKKEEKEEKKREKERVKAEEKERREEEKRARKEEERRKRSESPKKGEREVKEEVKEDIEGKKKAEKKSKEAGAVKEEVREEEKKKRTKRVDINENVAEKRTVELQSAPQGGEESRRDRSNRNVDTEKTAKVKNGDRSTKTRVVVEQPRDERTDEVHLRRQASEEVVNDSPEQPKKTVKRVEESPSSRLKANLVDRRDSSVSESSHLTFASNKSVKFSDRIQMHEIERREHREASSDDEDYSVMSDREMRSLRAAAEARLPARLPAPAATSRPGFDERYAYAEDHWTAHDDDDDGGGGDFLDLDQLPVSVRRAIELEMAARMAALTGAHRDDVEDGTGGGSMTRLHDPSTDDSLLSYPLLPRSASGYFDDPLRDSYQAAINQSAFREAMRQQERTTEFRRREELELLALAQRAEAQRRQMDAERRSLGSPASPAKSETGTPTGLLGSQSRSSQLSTPLPSVSQAASFGSSSTASTVVRPTPEARADATRTEADRPGGDRPEAYRSGAGLPATDLQGSFYDNVSKPGERRTVRDSYEMGGARLATDRPVITMDGYESSGFAGRGPSATTPNPEAFSYAPRRRQDSEMLPVGRPASPTPSGRSSVSADRAAFFASMEPKERRVADRSSSSVERQEIFGGEGDGPRIGVLEATPPPPEGGGPWTEAEERMRRRFVERFGARKAPTAEDETLRRGEDADSVLSTDSRESVVSETSLRAEPVVRRHFNY